MPLVRVSDHPQLIGGLRIYQGAVDVTDRRTKIDPGSGDGFLRDVDERGAPITKSVSGLRVGPPGTDIAYLLR